MIGSGVMLRHAPVLLLVNSFNGPPRCIYYPFFVLNSKFSATHPPEVMVRIDRLSTLRKERKKYGVVLVNC